MISETEKASFTPQPGKLLTFGLLDVIGRAVVIGNYERAFLTEGDLARQFGVSRSTTREAMKMLAAKGLLDARPKRGTAVRPEESWNLLDNDVLRWLLGRKQSIGTLCHLKELRIAVEPQAASLAATRAQPARIAEIAAGLQRIRGAQAGNDDALEADITFHLAVLRASGNPLFLQFREFVAMYLRTVTRFTGQGAGRATRADDYAAVYAAIDAGDHHAAYRAMRKLVDEEAFLTEHVLTPHDQDGRYTRQAGTVLESTGAGSTLAAAPKGRVR